MHDTNSISQAPKFYKQPHPEALNYEEHNLAIPERGNISTILQLLITISIA